MTEFTTYCGRVDNAHVELWITKSEASIEGLIVLPSDAGLRRMVDGAGQQLTFQGSTLDDVKAQLVAFFQKHGRECDGDFVPCVSRAGAYANPWGPTEYSSSGHA